MGGAGAPIGAVTRADLDGCSEADLSIVAFGCLSEGGSEKRPEFAGLIWQKRPATMLGRRAGPRIAWPLVKATLGETNPECRTGALGARNADSCAAAHGDTLAGSLGAHDYAQSHLDRIHQP